MNNNKKYKKWSLGLVAPALVLAPIAVVASCSSSTEEKEAYAIKFTTTDQIKATTHKTVQPKDLTNDQFKDEVLNHLSELFSVDGKLPAEDFISKNIEISELKPSESDDKKEVSAKVKVNNANTSGESIEKTITLTGLGYEEVDLTKKEYTIELKKTEAEEITLDDQSGNSVETVTQEQLIKFVISKKGEILTITDTENILTDEVLENQILTTESVNKDKTTGKITFTLNVAKPKNGEGETLTKEITFAGFKVETDSTPPASPKYKITLKTTTPEKEYQFTGIDTELASATISTGDDVRDLIIKNKDKMFDFEGDVPNDETWWKEKLVITSPTPDDTEGKVTFNLVLDDSNTIDEPTDSDGIKINETDVVIKGFKKQAQAPTAQETLINSDLSTVTLGLNGNRQEVKTQINQQWILEHKRILFRQGFQLITDANDIVASSIQFEDVSGQKGNPIKLKFKVAANKWYDSQPAEGTTEKPFETVISGISGAQQQGLLLTNKSDASKPLSIGLVDPALAEGTYEEFVDKAAEIFNKKFVFNYRKNLLTGDFSKIDTGTADDFLVDYGGNSGFVKVAPDDSGKTIQITFKIKGAKLVNSPQNADKEYSVIFNGFKGN